MRYLFCVLSLFCAAVLFAADDAGNNFQVKAAVTGYDGFALSKELKVQAKKTAIKKYLQRLNANLPEKLSNDLINEYDRFVDGDLVTLNEQKDPLPGGQVQLSGDYSVTLNLPKLNQFLENNGVKVQGQLELIILEEPPALAQMKLDKAVGSGLDGRRFFIQNYTMFQRRVRDALIKKTGEMGFDVKLLEDNRLYDSFKNKDSNLSGVYFDVGNDEYAVNRDLLDAVRENNPDTLVLYYRIDALIYDQNSKKVRATVALNLKNLATGVTKSIGTATMGSDITTSTPEGVIDDLAYCTDAAMVSLMNAEGAAAKINNIAQSMRSAAALPAGPLKLIINASAFGKNQKKIMYNIKNDLITKKLCAAENIRSTDTTLTATVDRGLVKTPDVLYFEHIVPILEANGVTLDDDHVVYSPDSLTIKP